MANLKVSCFPYLFKLSCLWMGNSASSGGSVSAGTGYKACLYSPKYEESCLQHEEYTSDIVENSLKLSSLEDLEISSSSEEEDLEHLMVQKLGTSLSEVDLQIHDTLEPLFVSNIAASQDENCNNQDTQPLFLAEDVLDGSSNHMNDLCSSMVQPYPLTLDVVDILSHSTVHNDDFSKTENLAPAYPLPIQATKLISALKGSREKQGKCPGSKLSVKWAPDVYDPPITSTSHTLRGHQRHYRHKAKKDHHSHKSSRIKSPRGNAVERKHAHRRTSSGSLMDARVLRSQALGTCNSQSKAESPEHAIRGSPETIICGSFCYMEPLTPLPFHVAEAS